MIHIPINTICLQIEKWSQPKVPTWPLIELLPEIKKAGFHDIEAWGPHVTGLDDEDVEELAAALDAAGLEIPSLGAYLPIRTGQPLEEFWDPAGRCLTLCTDLGITRLRVMPGGVASAGATAADWQYIPELLGRFCREAAHRDVVVVAETHGNTLADSVGAALRLVEAVGQPNFRLLFQSYDFQTESTLDQWAALHEHVGHVHLQNRDADGGFTPLAEGTLDYRRLIGQMRADGYNGDMVIEFTAGCVVEKSEDYDLAKVLAHAAADREFALESWASAAAGPA